MMAADYLPIRLDLWDDPRIVKIARELNCGRAAAVGASVRIWSAANRYSHDGALVGYSATDVDTLVGIDGFAREFEAVGWLTIENEVVTIPEFDRWNSYGAKRRLADRQRKQESRDPSAKCPQNVRNASDKKRTTDTDTDTSKTPLPPFPETVDSPRLRQALSDWLDYKGKRPKPRALKALVTRIANRVTDHGEQAVVDAIERSMAQEYKGWDIDDWFVGKGPAESRVATAADLENFDLVTGAAR